MIFKTPKLKQKREQEGAIYNHLKINGKTYQYWFTQPNKKNVVVIAIESLPQITDDEISRKLGYSRRVISIRHKTYDWAPGCVSGKMMALLEPSTLVNKLLHIISSDREQGNITSKTKPIAA